MYLAKINLKRQKKKLDRIINKTRPVKIFFQIIYCVKTKKRIFIIVFKKVVVALYHNLFTTQRGTQTKLKTLLNYRVLINKEVTLENPHKKK